MNQEQHIEFLAHMLDEAMEDKSGFCEDVYEQETLDERRMSGPASGDDEIADFREKLASGVVEFEFTKVDGTLRHAVGTTSERVFPVADRRRLDPQYDQNLASYERRAAFTIWFWDLEKNAVRCFNTNRFERLIDWRRTDTNLVGTH